MKNTFHYRSLEKTIYCLDGTLKDWQLQKRIIAKSQNIVSLSQRHCRQYAGHSWFYESAVFFESFINQIMEPFCTLKTVENPLSESTI